MKMSLYQNYAPAALDISNLALLYTVYVVTEATRDRVSLFLVKQVLWGIQKVWRIIICSVSVQSKYFLDSFLLLLLRLLLGSETDTDHSSIEYCWINRGAAHVAQRLYRSDWVQPARKLVYFNDSLR